MSSFYEDAAGKTIVQGALRAGAFLCIVLLGASTAGAGDLEVTSPEGGTFEAGQSLTVTWRAKTGLSGTVSLRLIMLRGMQTQRYWLAQGVPIRPGTRSVRLPANSLPGQYVIQVSHGRIRARSAPFRIRRIESAGIQVSSPSSGTFQPGADITIAWTTTRLAGEVSILLRSADSNRTFVITTGVRHDRGSLRVSLPPEAAPGRYYILIRHPDLEGRSATFRIQSPGADTSSILVPGQTEYSIESIVFLKGDRSALPRVNEEAMLAHGRIALDPLRMRVVVHRRGTPSEPDRCSAGVAVNYTYSHQPQRRITMGGTVFTPSRVQPAARGTAQAIIFDIPFRIPGGTPPGTLISGTVSLLGSRIQDPHCDRNRADNQRSFGLRLAESGPRGDLRCALTNLRVNVAGGTIWFLRWHAELNVIAEGNSAPLENVFYRYVFTFQPTGSPRDAPWQPLGDGEGRIPRVTSTVYAGPTLTSDDTNNRVGGDKRHRRVRVRVEIDPEGEFTDPNRGNNSCTITGVGD